MSRVVFRAVGAWMVTPMLSRKAHLWWSIDGTDIINVRERTMREECGRSRG